MRTLKGEQAIIIQKICEQVMEKQKISEYEMEKNRKYENR